MNKTIAFLTVILVVVLLAGAGVVWFMTQNNSVVPPAQVKNSIEYVNSQYGFKVSLPQSWRGYSVVTGTWSGDAVSQNGQVQLGVVQGPMISIRNPLWTTQAPYQDIPVMIFTLPQWSDLQQEKFHVGAAPIPPSQLGVNSIYVLALPARYNYAYITGWQEVDQILSNNSLQTFTPETTDSSTTTPRLDSVLPTFGPVGTRVTLSGSGFTSDNTILFDGLMAASHIPLVNNAKETVSFLVPSSLTANCKPGQACPMFLRNVTPDSYYISVENQNGVSNVISFTVTTNANTVTKKVGDKEFNFLVQKINANSVDGLWYTLYPVAMAKGQPKTLHVGDTVGYACEGKTATLTSIDSVKQIVIFNELITTAPMGGCPI